MNLQLYIKDELVDLSDDSPMAVTFQINNLAEVKNQQGNTSNQFQLPLTQRNRRILGYPDEVPFTDNQPYQQYPAKVVQNGLEIIPYAVAELNSIDQDMAAITILSGNVDFFDALEGRLYDMGDSLTTVGKLKLFNSYEHDWTLQNVVQSQTKTEGWIWPVVDYGTLPDSLDDTPQIDVRNLRPGFFLHTAIELLAKAAGYKIAPGCFLLKDSLYPNLIVQFANGSFEHGADFQNSTNNPYNFSIELGTDLTYGNIDQYAGTLPLNRIVQGSSTNWDYGDNTYKAPASLSVTAEFVFSATVYGNPSQHNNQNQTIGIEIRLKRYFAHGGIEELTSTTVDLSNNPTQINPLFWQYDAKNVKLTYDVDLDKDDHIYIEYSVNNNKKGVVVMKAGSALSISVKQQKVLYTQPIQAERIFPDMAMKDLLKDTLQRFGIICQTDNATRTVNFASFRDIVNNIPRAIDWSSRCLDQGKSISFQLGGYAQVNTMKYKEDDAVLPAGFADAQINVADKTLPATADLFESQFAPSLNRPFPGGTIAQIKMNDADSDAQSFDFSTGVSPRILVNQQTDLRIKAAGKSVVFTDDNTTGPDVTVNGYISTPYFYKTDGQYNLCFSDVNGQPGLKTIYYPELEKILKQSKKVVRYFLLTPRDILELDLLIPIYLQQDGCYYYINKIDSWRAGQPTKVELVKLG